MDLNTDPSKIPLAPNPNGNPPNFVDPPTLEHTIHSFGIALMIISVVLLLLRLYANLKHTGRFRLDDGKYFLCIIGWATASALWIITDSIAADGIARHAWDVPRSVITTSYMKRTFAQEIIGTCAMWVVKACILTLFIRIFDSVRWMRMSAYAILIIAGLFYLASIAIWVAYCAPRPGKNWDSDDLLRTSSSKLVTITVVATGVASVAIDCTMFVLPFPIIAHLQLDWNKKIRLVIVFSVALCTVVAACASLVYRIRYFQGAKGDVTWVSMNVLITSSAEQFGTVIVSCAPALSSFWNNIFTKTRLYSTLRSRLSRRHYSQETLEGPKTCPYASQMQLTNVEMKAHDPYPVTDGLQSVASEDYVSLDQRPTGSFITSAITMTTHIETRTDAR
ncbi:hypothetical protein BKA66DRAFT_570245 [Pyrenochaeta sp. MPI-SDFR-AT-0127]|nr:hypothetical protein BKA66DRAFT_570245 [Pyrenochaeta sp. MPI-SDFR-AT-0127]